jgi:hypothetical protein
LAVVLVESIQHPDVEDVRDDIQKAYVDLEAKNICRALGTLRAAVDTKSLYVGREAKILTADAALQATLLRIDEELSHAKGPIVVAFAVALLVGLGAIFSQGLVASADTDRKLRR